MVWWMFWTECSWDSCYGSDFRNYDPVFWLKNEAARKITNDTE